MKKRLNFCLSVAIFALLVLPACSKDEGRKAETPAGEVKAATVDNGGLIIPPAPASSAKSPAATADSAPATLVLDNSLIEGVALAQDAQAIITARLTDSSGNPVADGTAVTFIANQGTPATVVTKGGAATVNYAAGASGGSVTITASAGDNLTGTISFSVDDGKTVPLSGGL